MKIQFNSYKGFVLADDSTITETLNIRDGLTPLSISNNKKSKKGKGGKNQVIEYKTDGFDVLNYSWNRIHQNFIDDDDDDDENSKIKKYGSYLRNLCYKSEFSNSFTNNSDLSSHTTIYGQELNDVSNSETVDGTNDEDNSDKNTQKPKKLSVEERKRAREEKKLAKLNRQNKKKNSQIADTTQNDNLDLTSSANLSSSRLKIKHLKSLLQQCMETAESNVKELSNSSVIFQIDDVSFYCNDLPNLCDDEWLSDSNIAWFYAFVYNAFILPLLSRKLINSKFYQFDEKLKKEVFISPICILLPTFTSLIANHPDPKELVTGNVLPSGISDGQFVFCPLNDNDDFGASEGGSHWSLVVFVKLQSTSKKQYTQKALVFDSMFQANESETNQLVQNMSKILYNENDPKSSLDWDIVHVRDTPQQTNGSDCGVFVTSISSVLISQLILLAGSSGSSVNAAVDFSLHYLRFSSIDSRIWLMSTILNCLKNPSHN